MAVAMKGLVANFNKGFVTDIAKNSLNVDFGQLLKYTAWTWVDVAGAGETIIGISVTDKTYDSDNYTVDKARVVYLPTDNLDEVLLPITGGTITYADEGKFYDLTTAAVDWTSESTTTGQVKMTKFLSATLAWFRIVNA